MHCLSQRLMFQMESSLNPGSTEVQPMKLTFSPLKELYFTKIDPYKDYMDRADRGVLLNMFFLGLGILLLGIINYVNLATARSNLRV